MKYLLKIIVLIILLVAKQSSFAQTYDFRNFNVEEGLAQSMVLSMCQDRYGNIWFGTNGGGVSKYDGNKFVNITENDGLANNVVFSITELTNGIILFGTNGGVSIYDGKTFLNLTVKDKLPDNRVYKIIQDKNEKIWIGTSKGACLLENNKIVPFKKDTLLNKSNVWTICSDKSNNIWFGTTERGVIKYNTSTDKFSNYDFSQGLQSNFVRTIYEKNDGYIYVGTIVGINKISPLGKVEEVGIPKNTNIGFSAIASDKRNNLWLTTNEGLYEYNGYITRKFREENGLVNNSLISLLIDREGNFWFGTYGSGVEKFNGEAFHYITSREGLQNDYVTAVFQDSKKNIWIGLQDFGAVQYQNKVVESFTVNPKKPEISLPDRQVNTIAEDNNGNIYFGTHEGISIYDGKKVQNYLLKEDGLLKNIIYSIIKDKNGLMWIGSKGGLSYFKDGKFIYIDVVNSIKTDNTFTPIYSIYEDENNDLWLGTEKGVIKYNHKTAVHYTKSSGFTDKRVLSVTKDKFNYLWFGTDEGVFYYDDKSFNSINQNSGLASNKIYLLLSNNNYLWVGTNKGLDRIDLPKLHTQQKIEIKHYGKEEGFKGLECNMNAQMREDDGTLWFGTIKGATLYNPMLERINQKEALTRITGIRLFFKTDTAELRKDSKGFDTKTNLPLNLILPYDKNHITFDFIGVCLTNPSKVKYQFKLTGADADWFPPTSTTVATYSSLPPGEYTFNLKAMNNDGLWNKNPVTFHFTILPPWWKTWWFYTLSAIFMITSIYLFIVNRTRNLQKAKILLEQEVELRTHELREEKEKVELINEAVLEQKAIIEMKNNDITDSIKYAKNIQEALLPPMENLLKEMNDAFVLYLPKDIVSGDFYWFHKRNNKRFIASVDCTGHGVPGAFMSIIGNTLLGEIVSDKNIMKPSEILNELHSGVKTALKQSNSDNERRDGMDIALCALNEDSTLLEFAGANRPLWIFRKNKKNDNAFEMIKANKFPIGGLEMEGEIKREFTNHEIALEKGDIVYLFSDGFADQFGGPKGKKFMLGNLQKLVAGIYDKPIKEQEKLIYKAFNDWKGEIEQIDDVLVIGFRV